MVEFRTLALMDRHGKDRFVFWQPEGMKGAEPAVHTWKKDATSRTTRSRGQENPDVPIEKMQVIVISANEHRPARIPPAGLRKTPLLFEEPLHQVV